MRPKIHGWTCGFVIFGAGCLGIAARAVCDPPALAPADPVQSAGELSVAPLATPKPSKTPRLLTPPSRAGASGEAVKSATLTNNETQQPILRISYEHQNGDQAGNETTQNPGDKRPVPQFARQVSNGRSEPQQPRDSAQQDVRRPVYQPGSGQVPANIGQVEVQGLDQLGIMILRGSPQDVEAMKKIIEEIQKISEAVEPYIRVFQLKRATASAVRDTLLELYSGSSSTTSGSTRSTTQGGGGQGGGAGQATAVVATPALKRFQIAADDRSNKLIVSASPAMMEELSRVIDQFDVDGAAVVNEVRVFQLKNAEATEVTNILTQAIAGQSASTSGATLGATTGGGTTAGTVSGGGEAKIGNRTSVLRFVSPDGEARAVQSGILDNVLVTAQVRTNSVIVSAPASSMALMASVIAELDKPSAIVASMKVFPLKNADASNLRLTLQELFDLEATTGTGGGAGGAFGTTNNQFQRPIQVAPGENPPVSIRVGVDERTNSLIVTGPDNALIQIEVVIRKLDEVLGAEFNRRTSVYRLKHADAEDVSTAMQTFFTNKRTIEGQQTGVTAGSGTIVGSYQRFEQEVVVVPLVNNMAGRLMSAAVSPVGNAAPATAATQGVSNMLLISASPRYYEQVMEMIEELDAPQPQVMIQCIIAQLTLNDDFEFGIEFGLQNDVLFGRGDLASNPLNPGFNFNTTDPLPNSTVFRPAQVGNQALGNLQLGRASLMDGLGAAGGMILTASSQNIGAMLRAIQGNRQLEILSRPQIMTMDGRTARVFVGENFPYLGAINTNNLGSITQQVDYQPIGTSLTVKPSITPDDRIYLEIVPEVTELKELVEFSTLTTRQQAPRTSVTAANTVVSVNSGQTLVLAGLIQKRHTDFVRKIPWLGDLPCVGFLFRYTQDRDQKQELLIFMTPHIVRNEDDAQRVKNTEMARMSWIVNHSAELHGDLGLTADETRIEPPHPPQSGTSGMTEHPVINPASREAKRVDGDDASSRRAPPVIRLMNLEPARPEAEEAPLLESQPGSSADRQVPKPIGAVGGPEQTRPAADSADGPKTPNDTQQHQVPERKSFGERIRRVLGKS